MLFNSHAFTFLFLPIVIFLFVFLSIRNIPQKFLFYTIIAASLVFVLIGDFLSLALLLTSLFCNYEILHKLSSTESEDRRRYLLIFGIVFNLSFIGVFKYADFFLVNLNYFLAEDIALLQDRLPLAISFYTFQLIALLVDSWKDRRPCLPPERLALFVSFFPQLIAGPIVRYQEVEKDLGRLGIIDLKKMATGASIFFIGLFKKTVIADNLAPIANIFYSAVEKGQSPSFFEAWGGSLAYTFQIYFDFSAYSDMAIGLALIFGISLPINFYSPYKAASIIEFWRRWHMTLSRFLRDYLYIPLGGNRGSVLGRWRNVFVTMLLGGLWHGASWNFVLWGGAHGLLIAANHAVRRLRLPIPTPVGWILTMLALVVTWVLFRTPEVDAAGRVFAGMAGFGGIVFPVSLAPYLIDIMGDSSAIRFESSELIRMPAFVVITFAAAIAFFTPNTTQIFFEKRETTFTLRVALLTSVAGCFGIFGLFEAASFVYFRF